MDRERALKNLIEQLKKLPDRKMCATVVTREQLQIIAEQIVFFRIVTDYLEDGGYLDITKKDIPNDLWFELVLFISLEQNQKNHYGILNWEMFKDPEKITEMIKKRFPEVKQVLEESKDGEIAYIDLEKVLAILKH